MPVIEDTALCPSVEGFEIQASVAMSLKRIADSLDRVEGQLRRIADALEEGSL